MRDKWNFLSGRKSTKKASANKGVAKGRVQY